MGLLRDIAFNQYERWLQQRDVDRAAAILREQARGGPPAGGAPPAAVSGGGNGLLGGGTWTDRTPISATNSSDFETWADLRPFAASPGNAAAAPLPPATGPGMPAVAQGTKADAAASTAMRPPAEGGPGLLSDPDDFLAFTSALDRAGINVSDYFRAQERRRQLEDMSAPEWQALPPDQRMALVTGHNVPTYGVSDGTVFNRFGAAPQSAPTEVGQSKAAYNQARAQAAAAQAGAHGARTDLYRAQADVTRAKDAPVTAEINGQTVHLQKVVLRGANAAYVRVPAPQGANLALPPPTTPAKPREPPSAQKKRMAAVTYINKRHSKDERDLWTEEEWAQRMRATLGELYPSDTPAESAADSLPQFDADAPPAERRQYGATGEWGTAPQFDAGAAPWEHQGARYEVGQVVAFGGLDYRVVGRMADGQPYFERAR